MLQFSLAFLCGDLWLQWQPALTAYYLVSPCCVVAVLWLIPWSRKRVTSPVIVAWLLGFCWAALHAQVQLRQQLAPSLEGQDLLVSGYVADIPEQEAYGQRFMFVVEHSDVAVPQKIELTWYQATPIIHAAERWQLLVRMKRPHGFANLGGYDYEAQLFRQGIGATGYIRNSPDNERLGVDNGQRVLQARAWLTQAIATAIPGAAMQGVVRGLAVGDQQAVSDAAWQVFARTGTSHLMAISGFHIGMVAAVFAWLGTGLVRLPMAQRYRITAPDLQALFGMSAALGYSLLAGMSVPTQRTLIMLAVYFGARLLRREVHVWHSFGLALLLVLILDPFAPLAAGAWLSFGAVAVILLNQHGRVGGSSWWRGFLSIQGVVSVGLVPLLLSSFGNLSLLSPLINLFAIPVFTGLLVPMVLLSCALLVVDVEMGTQCLQWVAWLLEQVYAALHWAAQLPWATWYAPTAPWWAMGLLVLGTVMMVLPWIWPWRLIGALSCLPALAWQPATPALGGFELTVLDVGQGLAVVVRTRHHVLLYDTGPSFQSGHDTGELVVLPYLRAQGVHKLDLLMLSHGDADHVGGLQSVLAGMQVAAISGGPSVKQQAAMKPCQRGQQWHWDGVQFDVLHPQAGTSEISDNNLSCVLRVSTVVGSALLLGDIEKAVEYDLVTAGFIRPTDIVVAAHHGSRSSSTTELVAATQISQRTQWVIFSAGYRNRWGFPKEDVVARWRDSGAMPLSTSAAGAVTLSVARNNGVVVPSLWRERHRRYWQTQQLSTLVD
ncbi:MAG: DNA internalization-related competence protein ComEC/Rec2 [Steroidobacteraceae bacterium]